MKILIVEDEVKIRHGISGLITKLTEHEVVGEAKNGEEGLVLVQQEKPDVIITDVRMPQMDGLEMINKIRQLGFKTHCVILSGYSEFEYAKQAIVYGVDQYLLKPLAPDDILKLLDELGEKVKQEKQDNNVSLQVALEQLISGEITDEHRKLLYDQFLRRGVKVDSEVIVLCGYAYNASMEDMLDVANRIRSINVDGLTSIFDRQNQIVSILPMDKSYTLLQDLSFFFGRTRDKFLWVYSSPYPLKLIAEGMKEVRSLFTYAESNTIAPVISQREVDSCTYNEFVYSKEYENKLKSAIYKSDTQAIESAINDFTSYCNEKNYNPDSVLNGNIRLTKKLLHYLEESESSVFDKLTESNLEDKLNRVCTRYEIKQVMDTIIVECHNAMDYKDDVSNYALKRAISYIRTNYQKQISLEAIAGMLEITPEYLSMLFNREMGMNFSVFLRDFRISHAKRLLKDSELKIYEIAEQTGYSNTKYFNKVFRESVGCSPKEYRQMK